MMYVINAQIQIILMQRLFYFQIHLDQPVRKLIKVSRKAFLPEILQQRFNSNSVKKSFKLDSATEIPVVSCVATEDFDMPMSDWHHQTYRFY